MTRTQHRIYDGSDRPGAAQFPRSPLGEGDTRIPTGRDVEWEPLVDYRRNGVSETTIHGAVGWASGDEIVHSFGGNVLCYGRSMMKPFYVKPFCEALDDCVDNETMRDEVVSSAVDMYATLDSAYGLVGELTGASRPRRSQPLL